MRQQRWHRAEPWSTIWGTKSRHGIKKWVCLHLYVKIYYFNHLAIYDYSNSLFSVAPLAILKNNKNKKITLTKFNVYSKPNPAKRNEKKSSSTHWLKGVPKDSLLEEKPSADNLCFHSLSLCMHKKHLHFQVNWNNCTEKKTFLYLNQIISHKLLYFLGYDLLSILF